MGMILINARGEKPKEAISIDSGPKWELFISSPLDHTRRNIYDLRYGQVPKELLGQLPSASTPDLSQPATASTEETQNLPSIHTTEVPQAQSAQA